MNADPMNDPSTEVTSPSCSICGQPAVAAYIHKGKAKSHCPNEDCRARAWQLSHSDAAYWRFDEPWPAGSEDAPTGGNLGGEPAEQAGQSPARAVPGGIYCEADLPPIGSRLAPGVTCVPARELVPDPITDPALLQAAQEAIQQYPPIGSDQDPVRKQVRDHAYLAFLEALEAHRGALRLSRENKGNLNALPLVAEAMARCFAALDQAGELVDSLAQL
jgi:hypothetical protein